MIIAVLCCEARKAFQRSAEVSQGRKPKNRQEAVEHDQETGQFT